MSKRIVAITLIALIFSGVFIVKPAIGDGNEGGQAGGSGLNGCNANPNWTLDTCTGAEWRYYKTTSNKVEILGNRGNNLYAHSATITGCGEAGGYWRYAMVAYREGTLSDGKTKYKAGDQVGVIGMAGNNESVYDSIYWSSSNGMNYYTGKEQMKKDFKKVQAEYEKAQEQWPEIFTLGFNSKSNLSWFCSGGDQPEYYSVSNVSNRSSQKAPSNGSGTVTTGIVKDSKTARSSNREIEVGAVAYVTFSHDAYATKSKSSVGWEVTRTVTINGTKKNGFKQSGYTISMPGGSSYSWNQLGDSKSGTINITEDRGSGQTPRYRATGTGSANSRKKTDGNEWYVSRDFYRFLFIKEGVYDFCETFSLNGKEITKACSKITVVNPDNTPGECDAWAPNSYKNSSLTSGTSSVVSKVKNTTIGGDWSDRVYAKPGDKTNWIHCFYPGAQWVYNMDATGIGVVDANTGGHAPHSGNNTNNSYAPMSELYGNAWDKSYLEITTNNIRAPQPKKATYAAGDWRIKSLKDEYIIEHGEGINKVGKTLKETSNTGFPIKASVTNDGTHSWACGNETCHHSNDYLAGNAEGDSDTDSARVLVPYNFNTTASIELNDGSLFAGEAAQIKSMTVNVETRYNATTKGTYATNVDYAKIQVASYPYGSNDGGAARIVDGTASADICDLSGYTGCTKLGENDGLKLNTDGNLKGSSDSVTLSGSFNVYDAPAGTYYCVIMAVYPASSGSDTTMKKDEAADSWYISAPSCSKIAKKPTLQVWGSGMYTSGNVATPYAVKHIVDGELNDDPFSATAKDNIIFSSWVEQNIVANGLVSMASGAATGSAGNFNNTNNRTYNGLSGSYYGSDSGDAFCVVSPLTMPNNKCSSGAKPGGNSNSMNPSEEKEALLSAFTDEDSETGNYEVHSGVCSLGNINPDTLFSEKKTHVYKCNNNFAITGDIVALDTDGTYSSLEEIPKIIIYAKKNIYIDCSVGRVDAVIIAEENVRTCADASGSSPSVNSKDRSKQLVINGTVITNKLYAQRTYGASTGANSGVPAEIINYDTSLYLWGAPRADATGSGKLESVYQTELAPRY